MKFLIWPRQYGKSYRLMQWWTEDPAHRVILVENTNVAKQRQADLLPMLQEAYPENTHRENRLLLRNRIYASSNLASAIRFPKMETCGSAR